MALNFILDRQSFFCLSYAKNVQGEKTFFTFFSESLHVFISNHFFPSLKFQFRRVDFFVSIIYIKKSVTIFFCYVEWGLIKWGKHDCEREKVVERVWKFSVGTLSWGLTMPPWKNIVDQLRYEMKLSFNECYGLESLKKRK